MYLLITQILHILSFHQVESTMSHFTSRLDIPPGWNRGILSSGLMRRDYFMLKFRGWVPGVQLKLDSTAKTFSSLQRHSETSLARLSASLFHMTSKRGCSLLYMCNLAPRFKLYSAQVLQLPQFPWPDRGISLWRPPEGEPDTWLWCQGTALSLILILCNKNNTKKRCFKPQNMMGFF